jgi:Tol biopolymer transport system component/DNA-binding winged helix-turn-helix (wHTH) protein
VLDSGSGGVMAALSNGNQRLHLGAYEVDLKAGELRRNGNRIRLQEQPFQILAMLLERPGEVVTREELRGRLWPADTYVDFDHSLNAAVRRLRDALGDSAENPRFVETVARRGYRLLVPVIAPVSSAETVASAASSAVVTAPQKTSSTRAWWFAAGVAAILLVGTGLFVGWRLGRHSSSVTVVSERRLTANPSSAQVLSAAISPDGNYLAYADKTGVYLRQIHTGETHAISVSDNLQTFPVGWFPDGTHLIALRAVGANNTPSIWSISILGGPARKLLDDGREPAISPDGSQIAFLRGPNGGDEIWLMQADGSSPRRLLGNRGILLDSPAWSPDARHLAFLSGKYHPGSFTVDTQIEIADTESGHTGPVLVQAGLNGGIAWTRSGRLVFSVQEDRPNQEDSNLWYLPLDNTTFKALGPPVRITREIGAAHTVSVTADGKHLAYFRSTWQPDVYVSEIEAGGRLSTPRVLTLDERADYPYAWTPDSHSVIFASNRDGVMHIFRQAIDQATPDLLVGRNQELQIVRLTPDHSAILYLVTPRLGEPSTRVRLMRMPLSGGPPQLVLEANGINNHQCSSLPATLCVFSTMDAHRIRFFTFDSSTGASQEVPQWKLENADYFKFNWSLSPDGRTLAISGQREPAITLKSTRDASERTVPLPSWAGVASFDWSADGRSLWATAYTLPNSYALLNVDLKGHIQTVLQDNEMRIGWAIPSPDGRRLALWKASGDSNVWMVDNF